MLKTKSTSVITLTLLLAIAGTPKAAEASFFNQSHNQLHSEQIAQATNSTEDNGSSNEAKSKFPWWLLILVAVVPFVGWFFFGRDTQVDQESVRAENLATPLDSTSTNNNNYENFSSEIETPNNLNSPTPTNANFDDNTVMATNIATVSNVTNELQENNNFTREVSQTTVEELEQLSQVETNLNDTINQEPINLFEQDNQTAQPLTSDLENNFVDEVEQLSQVETDLNDTINQEIIKLFEQDNQTAQSLTSDLENNFIDEIEQLSQVETDLNDTINENLNTLLNENNIVEKSNNIQVNNELIEDRVGNITEWLEQLDLTFPLSDSQENIAEQDNNLNFLIELDETENNQDLESFEQLLFGDVDTNKEPKNQV